MSAQNFGATLIQGSGSLGEIDIVETVVERKMLKKLDKIFTAFDSNIFYISEDIRAKQRGIFPKTKSIFSRWRQGK